MTNKLIAFLVSAALLLALSIPAFAHAAGHHMGCKGFGEESSFVAQSGELGLVVSGVARSEPGVIAVIVDSEREEFCG
jgi:hypothetical protein